MVAVAAGNSASSNAPPPPMHPQKPPPRSCEAPPGSLRPSRPPPNSNGRSVIAALRKVRDDEAKRCRRVAEVQAEGKRRSLLEDKAHEAPLCQQQASGSASVADAISKQPDSGHSSPTQRSP